MVIFGDLWFFRVDLFLLSAVKNSLLQRKSNAGFRRRQEIVDENLEISQEVNRHGYSDNSRVRKVKSSLSQHFLVNHKGF